MRGGGKGGGEHQTFECLKACGRAQMPNSQSLSSHIHGDIISLSPSTQMRGANVRSSTAVRFSPFSAVSFVISHCCTRPRFLV